jgi:hypothetical protein
LRSPSLPPDLRPRPTPMKEAFSGASRQPVRPPRLALVPAANGPASCAAVRR